MTAGGAEAADWAARMRKKSGADLEGARFGGVETSPSFRYFGGFGRSGSAGRFRGSRRGGADSLISRNAGFAGGGWRGRFLAMSSRRPWTRDELLVALNIYHKLTFGQFDQRNPVIVAVAAKFEGRTPSSLAMKLSNLRERGLGLPGGFGRALTRHPGDEAAKRGGAADDPLFAGDRDERGGYGRGGDSDRGCGGATASLGTAVQLLAHLAACHCARLKHALPYANRDQA